MKYLISLLIITALFSQAKETPKNQLVIDAEQFEAHDSKGLSIFTGNVKMTRVKDKLDSDILEVYMTPLKKGANKQKRVVLKYIAIGNVSFEIFTKGKHYKGRGEKVIYKPTILEYEIIGKGSIKELTEDKTLIGDRIILNQTTGESKVSGSKNKPVRFIMQIESK